LQSRPCGVTNKQVCKSPAALARNARRTTSTSAQGQRKAQLLAKNARNGAPGQH